MYPRAQKQFNVHLPLKSAQSTQSSKLTLRQTNDRRSLTIGLRLPQKEISLHIVYEQMRSGQLIGRSLRNRRRSSFPTQKSTRPCLPQNVSDNSAPSRWPKTSRLEDMIATEISSRHQRYVNHQTLVFLYRELRHMYHTLLATSPCI